MSSLRARTAEALFQQLDDRQVPYCILRGYSGASTEPGRDIDIILQRSDLHRLRSCVTEQAGRLGWDAAVWCSGHHVGESFYFLRVNGSAPVNQLEVHATKVGWAGLPILTDAEILASRVRNAAGFWEAGSTHRAAQRLIQHALARRSIDEKTWSGLSESTATSRESLESLIRLATGSKGFAARTVAGLEHLDPYDVREEATAVRKSFVLTRLRRDGPRTLMTVLSEVSSRLANDMRPARCGVVAVVETRALAEGLASAVRSVFVELVDCDELSDRELKRVIDHVGAAFARPEELGRFEGRIWRNVFVKAGTSVEAGVRAVVGKFVENHELLRSATPASSSSL